MHLHDLAWLGVTIVLVGVVLFAWAICRAFPEDR